MTITNSLKLLGLAVILTVGSILIIQYSFKTHFVFSLNSSVYSSGFNQGCDDTGISDPSKRSVNQPGRNQIFTSDEFTKGYAAGFEICSKNPELEFLGVKIAPNTGDITAVAALIASALIFWFGYSRTRKSEQIRIAADLMDKIYDEFEPLFKYQNELPFPENGSIDAQTKWLEESLPHMAAMQRNVSYFTYLIEHKEINNINVINYYHRKINYYLDYSDKVFNEMKEMPHGKTVLEKYPGYVEPKVWAHKRISLFNAVFRTKGNMYD